MLATPSQIMLFNRNKSQRRHVLLYDNHIVFCKQVGSGSGNNSEKGNNTAFHFKFSLATNGVGMSSVVKVFICSTVQRCLIINGSDNLFLILQGRGQEA